MLTKERLKEMLALQELLEKRIDGPDWREKGHNYPLCIFMESAEIIDHWGWKHWKAHGVRDYDAIAMEIVDVWHFAMAHILMHSDFDAEVTYTQLCEAELEYHKEEKRGMIDLCIGMAYSAFATGAFPFGNFIAIMELIGVSWDQLYVLYISKNVLNWFRQDNGYKEGVYVKEWKGKEDNEHLLEIVKVFDYMI